METNIRNLSFEEGKELMDRGIELKDELRLSCHHCGKSSLCNLFNIKRISGLYTRVQSNIPNLSFREYTFQDYFFRSKKKVMEEGGMPLKIFTHHYLLCNNCFTEKSFVQMTDDLFGRVWYSNSKKVFCSFH